MTRSAGYVPAPQSFDALADRWLATLDVEHSTRVSYEASLKRYWRPRFGETIIDEIRHSEIKEVLAPLNAKTKNNTLIPMRGVMQMAVLDGLIEDDPTAKIKNAKVQNEPPDPLTLEEVETILADMVEHKLDQVANYFEAAFFTGMRPSEQIAVEWSDYARSRCSPTVQSSGIRILDGPGKTNRSSGGLGRVAASLRDPLPRAIPDPAYLWDNVPDGGRESGVGRARWATSH